MISEHLIGAVFSALPRYQFLNILGRGGMGVVYRALDLELDEPVALKVLWDSIAEDHDEMLARFKTEVSLNRRIKHPNVCRIHDFGVAAQFVYLTMELVPGVDLAKLVRDEGPLPLRRSLKILRQIAEGVAGAHAVGVLHRDLKPHNVMVKSDDGVTILDFGLARDKRGRGITLLGNAIGTPHYMSPEQAMGRTLDERSDLYSVGVIGFELLTGGLMYDGLSAMAIARQHVEDPVPVERLFEHHVPREVSAVLLRCLKKGPEQRFGSADELATQLSRLETHFVGGTVPDELGVVMTPPPADVATAVRRPLVEDAVPLDLQIEVPPARGAATGHGTTAPSPPAATAEAAPATGPGISEAAFEIVTAAAAARPVILVVDDDPQVRRVVSLHLIEGGFEPLQAATAMEALELLTRQPADAVLMDVQMPGMDGFDAVRILKSQPQFARLPIFLMSSFAERNRVAFAGQAGAVSFLRKPLNLPQVVKELREALESARSRGGTAPTK